MTDNRPRAVRHDSMSGMPEPDASMRAGIATLGPCPHCGFEGHWYEIEQKYDLAFEGDHQLWTYIECPHCHAHTASHADSDDAEADWNSGKYSRTLPTLRAPLKPPRSPPAKRG